MGLDGDMVGVDLDVVRLTLHVLAATVWVGGQVVLAALVSPLRRAAPAAVTVAAQAYARVAWPAFALLVLTGVWNVAAEHTVVKYPWALVVKVVLVALSGLGAALHSTARRPAARGAWGAVGLVGAVGALLMGVALNDA
jgi:putative copper export protein